MYPLSLCRVSHFKFCEIPNPGLCRRGGLHIANGADTRKSAPTQRANMITKATWEAITGRHLEAKLQWLQKSITPVSMYRW